MSHLHESTPALIVKTWLEKQQAPVFVSAALDRAIVKAVQDTEEASRGAVTFLRGLCDRQAEQIDELQRQLATATAKER